MAEFVILILGAYVLGSVPAAQVAAKLYNGTDLTHFGSGNVGVSNLVRATSKWVAIPVIIFDFGKGLGLVYLARQLGLGPYPQVAVGLATITGHNWSVFLKFNGGRGVLASLGLIFALEPRLAAIAAAIALAFAPFHEIALGVLVATAVLPIASLFISSPLTVEAKLATTLGLAAIFVLIVFRRLTAPLSPIGSTVKKRDLLLNRLLFDRDIRSREAWLSRSVTSPVAQIQTEEDKVTQ